MAQAIEAGRARRVLVDGADLEVFEGGGGPPLVALHGMIEIPDWSPYLDLISRDFRVIAPCHPGLGGSIRPAWLETIDDLAYFYLDLIDQVIGAEPVSVLGAALGGWIAVEAAIRCPRRFEKLILIDAVGLKVPGAAIADWLVLDPEQLRPLAWHDPATGDRLKLPAEAATTDEELTAILTNRETATLYGWKPFFHNPRLGRWLHRITAPTLVIWGEHDGVVPRAVGEAYATGIPNARLEIVPGAAHLPHLERPDEVARLVTEFLRG